MVPFVAGLGEESFLEELSHRRLRLARRFFAQLDQVWAAKGGEEGGDEIHLRAGQHHVLVIGCPVHVVERGATVQPFVGQHRRAVFCDHGPEDVRRPRHQGIAHRHVDAVAFPGRLAPQQRHQDRDQRARGQRDVRHGHGRQRRRAAFIAAEAQHAGHRLRADVVGGALRDRPRLPERRQRAEHDARRADLDRLVAQSQPVHHPGTERVDDHVAGFGQLHEDLAAFVAFEVERHRELATLGVAEIRGVAADLRAELAGRLAFVAFDLDHFRAVVGHREPDPRAGKEAGEVEHADAVEFHRSPLGIGGGSGRLICYSGHCKQRAYLLKAIFVPPLVPPAPEGTSNARTVEPSRVSQLFSTRPRRDIPMRGRVAPAMPQRPLNPSKAHRRAAASQNLPVSTPLPPTPRCVVRSPAAPTSLYSRRTTPRFLKPKTPPTPYQAFWPGSLTRKAGTLFGLLPVSWTFC